jgi:hypothetical protein
MGTVLLETLVEAAFVDFTSDWASVPPWIEHSLRLS